MIIDEYDEQDKQRDGEYEDENKEENGLRDVYKPSSFEYQLV